MIDALILTAAFIAAAGVCFIAQYIEHGSIR